MQLVGKGRQKGLVFIELLTILFIIVAIVLIAIPNFRWNIMKVHFSVCQSNLRNIAQSLQMYANDNEDAFPDELSKLTPQYLALIPTCPSPGEDTYSSGYDTSGDLRTYTVCCKGSNHVNLGLRENEPYWSLSEGGLKP